MDDTFDTSIDRLVAYVDNTWSEENCDGLIRLHGSFAAVDDQLERAERLALAANSAVQRLRFHRNKLCTINRIPTEILRAIFEQASLCGLEHIVNLAITHTCSYWRTVALGDPKLWSYFNHDFMTKGYTEAALQRSGDVPLHLIRHGSRRSPVGGQLGVNVTPPWIMEFWTTQIHRMRALYIRPSTLKPAVEHGRLVDNALVLESLEIAVTSAQSSRMFWTSKILGNQVPSLRSLTLSGCSMPWKPGRYKNLRELRIRAELPPAYTLQGDIACLCQESPQLEVLDVTLSTYTWNNQAASLPMADVWAEDDPRRTTMHHLRHLSLDMPLELAVRILTTIRITKRLESKTVITAKSRDASRTRILLSPECLPAVFFQDVEYLHVGNDRDDSVMLEGGCGDPNDDDALPKWFINVPTMPLHPGDSCDFRDVAASLQARHPVLPSLSHLYISEYVHARPVLTHVADGASLLLRHYAQSITAVLVSSLRIPEVDHRPPSTILQALCTSVYDHGIHQAGLFPVLQNITVEIAAFQGDEPEYHTCQDLFYVLHLARLAPRRVQPLEIHIRGNSTGRIAVASLNQAREFVDALRQLHASVHWTSLHFWLYPTDGPERCFYPREVWPEGEEYTWGCEELDKNGKHSEGGRCCGYSIPGPHLDSDSYEAHLD